MGLYEQQVYSDIDFINDFESQKKKILKWHQKVGIYRSARDQALHQDALQLLYHIRIVARDDMHDWGAS